MRSEINIIRLTRRVESAKMDVPAAPRNSLVGPCAPGTSGFLSSAFLRSMVFRTTALVLAAGLIAGAALAVTTPVKHKKKKSSGIAAPAAVTATVKPLLAASAKLPRKKVWTQTWDEPTYKDSTVEDKVDGEDLRVRKAAVDALGPLNGAVVVADPATGRILTIVNQPLALSGGFQPCSTIKVSVALAALREGLVERTSPVRFYSRRSMDLTDALAYSINAYFANLGVKLGYERMNYYAHLFGYGEKAGLNIEGEKPGSFPVAPPKNGGMGMLTSFGEEISQTPLELAGLMSAVANGGTLYWLQYPRSQDEVNTFRATGKTASRYRQSDRPDQAGDEGRGGVRYRGPRQTGRRDTRQDRHLQRRPDPLGMVWIVQRDWRTETGGCGDAHRWTPFDRIRGIGGRGGRVSAARFGEFLQDEHSADACAVSASHPVSKAYSRLRSLSSM